MHITLEDVFIFLQLFPVQLYNMCRQETPAHRPSPIAGYAFGLATVENVQRNSHHRTQVWDLAHRSTAHRCALVRVSSGTDHALS